MTTYRILVYTPGEGWDILSRDGDKPQLVTARSPEAAIETIHLDLTHVEGKAVAIPDSAWHEFHPRRGWAKV